MFKQNLNPAAKAMLIFGLALMALSFLSAEAYAQPLDSPPAANRLKNCASDTPEPDDANKKCTPTPTPLPTSTFTPTETPTPTATETFTLTPTETPSPTPTKLNAIVFVRPEPDTGADGNIWIMNPDGSNQTQLTTWTGEDLAPVISPNGSKVAYYSRRNNSWTLWVMNSDGTNSAQLPLTGDNSGAPAWSSDGSQIAFSNDSQDWWEIWVVNADGSNPHRLTTHGGAAGHPSWSPNGQKLVYGVEPSARFFDLYTVNSDGTGQSLLFSASGSGFSNHQPAWSPDGAQIATIHWPAGSSGPYDLWLMDADGSNGHTLVQNIDWGGVNNLAWSADSNWILFNKGDQIWRVRRDGTGLTQITTTGGWEPDTNADTFSNPPPTPISTPTLTQTSLPPSASAIVFSWPQPAGDNSVDSNIWIMNPDGSNQTQLTTSTAPDRAPVLSLDGSKIAYSAFINGRWTVWIINQDGTQPRQLSIGDSHVAGPAWSPDGTQLAVQSTADGFWEVWLINADGSNPRQLSHHPGAAGNASWSPNGQRLVYAVNPAAGYQDIYTINSDGTGQSLLISSSSGFSNHMPAWSPDGTQIVTIRSPAGSSGPYDLWLMNTDGSNGHILIQNIHFPDNNHLSWSRDSNWIIFVKGGQIWRIRRDGTGLTQITTNGGWEPHTNTDTFSDPIPTATPIPTFTSTPSPTFSPTPTATPTLTPTSIPSPTPTCVLGELPPLCQLLTPTPTATETSTLTPIETPSPTPTKVNAIVFVWPEAPLDPWSTDTNIWIMNPDGSNQTQLTTSTDPERLPAISPNGSKIVYQAFRNGRCTMWVMNRDGTNPTEFQVSGSSGNCGGPDWSPNGQQLAFSSDAISFWEIWVINADGTDPRRLSNTAGASGAPSWSPDGQKIVFESEPFARYLDLYTINSDGTGQTLLVSASSTGFSNHHPAWSPDGTQIATIHWPAGSTVGPYDLWLMNADGSNGQVLVQNIDHPHFNNVSWSADGNWLVFTKGGQIWRVRRDGTGLTQITTTGGWEPHTNTDTFSDPIPTATPIPTFTSTPSPTFTSTPTATPTLTPTSTPSPTPTCVLGELPPLCQLLTPTPTITPSPTATSSPTPTQVSAIVFVRPQPSGEGNQDTNIWIMNPDGLNQTQLTTWNAADRWPALFPDGSRITYVSYRNNNWTLWVMNSNGTNPAQLPMSGNTQSPAWSPDGNRIAFSNDSQDWWEVWTVNADGSNPQRLTTHPGASGAPAWSPTGAKIVYINEPIAWYHDLYTVNSDGTGQSLLISASSTGFSNHMPAWSPDGTQIATIHYPAGNSSGPFDLWLMNTDASNGHVLVQGIESPYYNNLSWSADSNWLLFAKNGQIWRVRRDGMDLTQITTNGGWEPYTNADAFSDPIPTATPLPTFTPTTTPTPTSTLASCVAPPAGMVSWWPGEGNADDLVGANHGNLQNGVTFTTGMVDQAFSFDGASGYVRIPDHASLRPADAMTIDAWIKPEAPLYTFAPIVKKAGSNSGYALEFDGNRVVFWVYLTGRGWTGSPSAPVPMDAWSHVAGVYDGASVSLYLDGERVGLTSASGSIAAGNEELNIGRDPVNTDRLYHGLIDEVELFNRALSGAEIRSISSAGNLGKCRPASTPTPQTPTPTPSSCVAPPFGMVSWWPGEGNADDLVGANHGNLQNGVTFTTGMVDQAFSFDGASGYVRVPDHASLRPADAMTIDAWIKPEAPLYTFAPIVKKAGSNSGYALEFDGNKVVFWVYVTGRGWIGSPSASVPMDAWSHVAGVYDGASVSLYLDGERVGSTSASGSIATGNEELNIGRDPVNTNRLYHGLIDEVELFNRALSGAEIRSIISAGNLGKCKPTPTPTPTPTITNTPTATPTLTQTPTSTPSPTPTCVLGGLPPLCQLLTPTLTITPTPTATSSPTPTKINAIVFTRPQPPGDGSVDTDIWIMDPDGSNQIQLTTWSGEDRQPALSPDGSKVAYNSRRNNLLTFWIMNSDGSNPFQLPIGADTQSPDWSPDGSQIAFTNDSVDWWEIWISNADGTNLRRLTTHGPPAGEPSWSPDGQKIIYGLSPAAGYKDLYLINSDGTGQSLFLSASGTGFSNALAVWSPAGNQIATVRWPAGSSGPYDLWLMNADGSNGQVLIQNIDVPHANHIAWSADGNWLVSTKGSQVWRIRPDGTGLTQITTTGGWEPDTNED